MTNKQNNLAALHGLWAMHEPAFKAMQARLNAAMAGRADVDEEDYVQDSDSIDLPEPDIQNGVAFIACTGVLLKYSGWMLDILGGTSSLALAQTIKAMANREDVDAIVIYFDSPGGEISGIQDAADAVANAGKPVVGVVSDCCASAAYWIASQCDYLLANKTAMIGSIGVYEVLADSTKLYEEAGIKMIRVRAGSKKGIGVDGVPITDADIETEQALIDDIYNVFVSAVSSNRQLKADIDSIATGECFITDKALALGLVDEVGDIQDAYSKLRGNGITMKIGSNEVNVNASKPATPVAVEADTKKIEAAAPVAAEVKPEAAAPAVEAPVAAVSTPVVAAVPAIDVESIKAEAVKAERERFGAILKACGGNEALAHAQYAAGADAAKAREAYVAALETKVAHLEAASKAGISDGTSPVVFAPQASSASTGDPVKDAERDWEANAGNCQKEFSKKEYFIEFRKHLAKQEKK